MASVYTVHAPQVDVDELPRLPAPSVEEFRRRFQNPARPVVLTGVVDQWPATGSWDFDHLAQRLGDCDVVALELAGGHVHVGAQQPGVFTKIKLSAFIASLRAGGRLTHYVSTPLEALASHLRDDYRVPSYCAGAAWSRPKLWIGGAGTVSPLHFDLKLNLYALVTGKKRFVLYPPGQSRLLYPCGPFSKAPNHAAVDPEAPDFLRFPRFTRARAVGTVLSAGEMLYVPRGWWHHVRTMEDSIAIGFWYGGRATATLSAASILYRRLLGQPPGEWGE